MGSEPSPQVSRRPERETEVTVDPGSAGAARPEHRRIDVRRGRRRPPVPYYFGENWAARHDCLLGLGWQPADDHLLLVTDAHLVLGADADDMWQRFLQELVDAHSAWSSDGTTSFRTILQVPPGAAETLRRRLQPTGMLDRPG